MTKQAARRGPPTHVRGLASFSPQSNPCLPGRQSVRPTWCGSRSKRNAHHGTSGADDQKNCVCPMAIGFRRTKLQTGFRSRICFSILYCLPSFTRCRHGTVTTGAVTVYLPVKRGLISLTPPHRWGIFPIVHRRGELGATKPIPPGPPIQGRLGDDWCACLRCLCHGTRNEH